MHNRLLCCLLFIRQTYPDIQQYEAVNNWQLYFGHISFKYSSVFQNFLGMFIYHILIIMEILLRERNSCFLHHSKRPLRDSNDLLARVAREFGLILFYPIQVDFYVKINHYRKSLNTLLPVVVASSLPHALPALLNH